MFEVLRWFLIMVYHLQTDNKTFPKPVLQQTSSDIAKMILERFRWLVEGIRNFWNVCSRI